MPNWVYNNLTITGDEKAIAEFKELASKPYTTYYEDYKTNQQVEGTHEGAIQFWNFIEPENKQVYFGASDYKPEGYEELSMEEKMAISMQFKSDGWYDWNIRNWGTKWDASDPSLNADNPTELQYSFSTAWSPAEGAYRAMVEQFPTLNFKFYCEEEQGWGVEYVGEDGELSVSDEWDIPQSHADYVSRDNEDGCACAQGWDYEDWYDDCPDNPKKTEEAVSEIEEISEMMVGQE